MRKILEVEGGFIAKEYDEAGSIVSQSEVFPTREEAEAGKANEVDPIEEGEEVEAPTAPAEEVPAPEAEAPAEVNGEPVPDTVTPQPNPPENAEGVDKVVTEPAGTDTPESTEAAPEGEFQG